MDSGEIILFQAQGGRGEDWGSACQWIGVAYRRPDGGAVSTQQINNFKAYYGIYETGELEHNRIVAFCNCLKRGGIEPKSNLCTKCTSWNWGRSSDCAVGEACKRNSGVERSRLIAKCRLCVFTGKSYAEYLNFGVRVKSGLLKLGQKYVNLRNETMASIKNDFPGGYHG